MTRPMLLAFGAGALTIAGFAPLYLFALPVITLAVLLHLSSSENSAWHGAKCGFAFGLGFFLAGVSWIYVSLHEFGAMPAPVAGVVTLLFCAFLALFPALACGLHARYTMAWRWGAVTAFPAWWMLGEWVRGWIFTGFPWVALGYAQAPLSPLAGYAPLTGVYGVTLLTVASAGLVHHAVLRPGIAARCVAASLLVGVWAAGYVLAQIEWTIAEGKPVSVSLIQGNIAQDMKWREDRVVSTLDTYAAMVLDSKSRLIVLPETAVPLFLHNVPDEYLELLARHARAQGADVLIGLPEGHASGAYYNSVVSLGASPAQTYRKSHLVPFGEFVPLKAVFGPLVAAIAFPLTDFGRGAEDQRPLRVAGQRVAVNICYEDVFGEELIRQLPEATLLVNASNMAWFGDSIAPRQHLQIAQMRAIETGRFMLRATNTGMTAIIDPRGRIVQMAEPFTRATVSGDVQGHAGATPYVRFGNTPTLVMAGMLIALATWLARRRS